MIRWCWSSFLSLDYHVQSLVSNNITALCPFYSLISKQCVIFFLNVHCDIKLKSPEGWEAVWLKKRRCSVNLSAARERGLIWHVFASSYSNADIKRLEFSPFLYISLHGAENEGEHLLIISSSCSDAAWSYSGGPDKSVAVNVTVSYNWLQRALYIHHESSKPEDSCSIRQNYRVKQGQGLCTTTNIKELL